jgi:glycosyltransferase involved in cell wall biosynthesis
MDWIIADIYKNIFTYIYYIYILATVFQLLFFFFVFSKFLFYKKTESQSDKKTAPSVSIVVCAHNEEKNLLSKLRRILAQTYHSFEVIVVDDHSTDNTASILLEYQQEYSYLRIVNNSYIKNTLGKKQALALGIEAAQYNTLLLTDADCEPESEFWIRDMVAELSDEKEIVLGYSPYMATEETLLNRWTRFEAIYTALQYFSFALWRFPYMGVGRNLLYQKHLYTQSNGFETHAHIASGDDDLFVNSIANGRNVAIAIQTTTFVNTEAKVTWSAYFRQKKRHFTTGKHYKIWHQLLLGALAASHCGHYGGAFFSLLSGTCIETVILIYLVRMTVVVYAYSHILNRFRDRSLLPWIPIMDAGIAIYYAILSPAIWIGNNRTWK